MKKIFNNASVPSDLDRDNHDHFGSLSLPENAFGESLYPKKTQGESPKRAGDYIVTIV